MNKAHPFLVAQSAPTSECVACNTECPAEKLARCICGSPICDCGIACPVCVEILEVYLLNLATYRAGHLHLLGDANPPRDLRWIPDQDRFIKAFRRLGWLC